MIGVIFHLFVVHSHLGIWAPNGWEPHSPITYLREPGQQGKGLCHPCIVGEEGELQGRGPEANSGQLEGREGGLH